jgi:purine-nucleoside phosphorylase
MNKNIDLIAMFSKAGLSPEEIISLAYETGFCTRKGKISPEDFVYSLCRQSMQGTVSYNDLAANMEAKTGVNASAQAYHQRMGPSCVSFFKNCWSKSFIQSMPRNGQR